MKATCTLANNQHKCCKHIVKFTHFYTLQVIAVSNIIGTLEFKPQICTVINEIDDSE